AHRERPGEQARDAREDDHVRVHASGTDARDEGQVRDEPVVRPEDGSAQRARELVAPAHREGADHLVVGELVGDHRRGGVGGGGVLRAGVGLLREGEHEHRAEVPREPREDARAQRASSGLARLVPEEPEPVRLVAALGLGEGEEDLALLARAPGGELAVDLRLRPLVGEVAAPATDGLRAGAARTHGPSVAGALARAGEAPGRRRDCELDPAPLSGARWWDGPRGKGTRWDEDGPRASSALAPWPRSSPRP